MFKVGKWRNEKIKVVFKLQFQATQVPCSKSKLMISVVPVDVGQPTVRLGKTAVQDGICTWENPVYESVKFIKEIKTGKLQAKFYHFIISTGSSKTGFLGEVSVNLADYVEATTPSTMSLPIKSSKAGAILHVTIQNIEGADDKRELQGENEENGVLDNSLRSQLSNSGLDEDVTYNTHENDYYNRTISQNDKGRKNIRNGSTFNSLLEHKDNRVHQEICDELSPSAQRAQNVEMKDDQTRECSILDWSSEDEIAEWLENEKKIQREKEQDQEQPKSIVEQFEKEIFSLKKQAEVTDIELQSLRRQVVKETKRGEDLSRQVVRLREERDALKENSEKLGSLQKSNGDNELVREPGTERKKSRGRKNEVDEELIHAKDLNRALRSKLRKAQDSNSELVLVVRDIEEKLDKKDRELAHISSKMRSYSTSEDFDTEHSEDQQIYHSKEVSMLQQEIHELHGELEGHVKEKIKVEKQIEQFSEDYEILRKENNDLSSKFNQKQLELLKKEKECAQNMRKVEELESQMARLERVITNQAEEFSESSNMINELETEVNTLHHELERQAIEFEEELKAITNSKVEQEQRALLSEENLRKMRLENANATQKLQEEFQKLSEELASKFKENEGLTVKAETEAKELGLRVTILDEHLQKASEELELAQDQHETEVQKLKMQLREKEKELEQIVLGHNQESEEFTSNRKKTEEKCEALSNENQVLRMEVERLTEANYYLTKQSEDMKTLVDETNTSFEEASKERNDLDKKYVEARMEIERSKAELKNLRVLQEKENVMDAVQSELKSLQVQHDELRNRLAELKLENENMRKQLARQKESLQKKDNEITQLEKLKSSSIKEVSTLKEKVKQLKAVRPAGITPENGSKVEERKYMGKKLQNSEVSGKTMHNGFSRTSVERRTETSLEKKTRDPQNGDLLVEVVSLKEKNKSMEDELKEMQDKYSEVSLKFAEVEGERQQLVMTIRNLRNGQKK